MSDSWLKHLLIKSKNKYSDEGFTLIELLVTIVIIAILSGIALPSMLKQSLKARESAAKSHIGSVNRAQQIYRLENRTFASTIDALGVGIPQSTDEYTYTFGTTNSTLAEFKATPTNNILGAFTGCANAAVVIGHNANTIASIKEQPADGSTPTPATPPNC